MTKQKSGSSTRRKVKEVIDGDTFKLHRKLQGSDTIRIANFNAPEKKQRGGNAATRKLQKLLKEKTVTIKPKARDKYGRIVADVVVNRKDVKKQL